MSNRRDVLKFGALGSAALALPAVQFVSARAGSPAPGGPFSVPLPIPPVLTPVYSSHNTDHYHLSITPGLTEIFPGRRTPVLTYNGHFPGPTIKARRNRPITVTVTNNMTTPSAVHLHGGNVPQDSDGNPQAVIQPGQSRIYRYPNIQPAATLWYHDHAHHLEAEQIYRGLSGLYLLEDRRATLPLPEGRFDIPLLLRDANLADNGELVWVMFGQDNRTVVLVNGVPQPNLRVRRRKYRLRFANGANERVFRLRLSTGDEFTQIATDGGLLAQPVRRTEIGLYAAERVEAVVDFSRFEYGTKILLENAAGNADSNSRIMQFEVIGHAPDDDTSLVPGKLSTLPPPGTPVVTRKVVLNFDWTTNTFVINGKPYDPDRVDFTIKRGSTEIWEIINADTNPVPIDHSMHLHLVRFRVLDRNGTPVEAWEAYPKDTVSVPSGQTVRILVTFDSPFTGIYPFHCHFVEHSSMAMMAQMEIVP